MADGTDDTSLNTDPPGLGDVSESGGKSSKPWLDMIALAEKAFADYQLKSDSIDKQYANLERLANTTRDREIQLFWANISVMAPSVYSRPPVPVVVPRFKQRDELPRTTSEMLERATVVTFEKEEIDGEMKMIRDDLVILSRGAAWLRYEVKGDTYRVCIDQADRKDFLHEAARKWKDVDWVSKRSWLTKDEAGKRFQKHSGEAYKSLDYAVRKNAKSDADDDSEKAGIWELWCKSQNKVVWVSPGCDVTLDEGKPHLDLEGFFPCPRPAFGTLQRRSLLPVPDMVFYKDQLEEINEITARIAALTEGLRVRGFYPAGAGDISDAIEHAFKATSNNQIMVPIANLSGLSGQSLKEAIAWLPVDVISATITAIIAIRKELISDVYEVTGLSDIMRGQTEASETLGAQQLKSQYGSVRIKDKQNELIRLSRDITRLTAEIIAENFPGKTLMEMAQMPLPSDADIEAKAKPLQAQLEQIQQQLPGAQQQLQSLQAEMQQAQADPEVQQMAQANPDQAKQVLSAAQQHLQQLQAHVQQMTQQGPALQAQLQTLSETVTIDKVMKLLREQKLRPFILDIETDSTIAPDENASKQRATEFVTAVGGYLKNSLPLVQGNPKAAPVVAETLKFITDQFRAGRQLQGVIDKFADDMEEQAQQPPPPNPEVLKAQQDAAAAAAKQQADTAKAQSDAQVAQGNLQLKQQQQAFEQDQAEKQQKIDALAAADAHDLAQAQLHLDAQIAQAKTAETSEKHAIEQQKTLAANAESQRKHDLEMRKAELVSMTAIEVARINKEQAAEAAALSNRLQAELGLAKLENERELQAREHAHAEKLANAANAANAQQAETAAAAKQTAAAQSKEPA